jgi:hypothetical protein
MRSAGVSVAAAVTRLVNHAAKGVKRMRSVRGCSYCQVWDLVSDKFIHGKPGATLVPVVPVVPVMPTWHNWHSASDFDTRFTVVTVVYAESVANPTTIYEVCCIMLSRRGTAVSETREIAGRIYTVTTLPPKLPKSRRNTISSKRIRTRNQLGRARQRERRNAYRVDDGDSRTCPDQIVGR